MTASAPQLEDRRTGLAPDRRVYLVRATLPDGTKVYRATDGITSVPMASREHVEMVVRAHNRYRVGELIERRAK